MSKAFAHLHVCAPDPPITQGADGQWYAMIQCTLCRHIQMRPATAGEQAAEVARRAARGSA